MKYIIDIPESTKNRLSFGITYQDDIQILCDAISKSKELKTELLEFHDWYCEPFNDFFLMYLNI